MAFLKNVLTIFFIFSFYGCSSVSTTVFYQMDGLGKINKKNLDLFIWENSLKADAALSNTLVLNGDLASYHLIQIRGSEKPHVHEFHDLCVFVQSGFGTMFLGKKSFKVRKGAVIFIPHGTPHYFVNAGSDPAVAFAVFSPSYDVKDSVPVELKPSP